MESLNVLHECGGGFPSTAVQGNSLKKYISNPRINAIFLLGMAKLSKKELNFYVSLINIFKKCIKPKKYANFLDPVMIIHLTQWKFERQLA